MKNKLLYAFLILGLCLSSCKKENFDHIDTTTDHSDPRVSLLPPGTWEVQFDTVDIQLDSSWCQKIGLDGKMTGFTPYTQPPSGQEIGFFVDFLTDSDNILVELGEFELTKFRHYSYHLSPPPIGSVLYDQEWEGNQVDGKVVITYSEEVFDTFYNLYRNEISGFINATVTDDDGTTHQLVSAFNKISQ